MINIERVAWCLLRLTIVCILITGVYKVTEVQGQQDDNNASADDIRFTSGESALKIPFELYNNHIYLQVGVNGSKPLSFIFDTGAPNLINSKQAKALGLKLKFVGKSSGLGENEVDVHSAKGITFQLAGVSLAGQQAAVIPLANVEACASEIAIDEKGQLRKCGPNDPSCQKRVIDGVLGHEFFKRFVVEINYQTRLINIYSPQNYKYQGSGEEIHLEMEDQNVFVQARLTTAGRAVRGRFMIDTGLAQSLLLTRPFIEANKLLPPITELTRFNVCGIGGYSEILLGTLNSLQVGNITVSEPVTGYSQAQAGRLTESIYDGTIGNAILRHYKVIFDYNRRRMILEPPSKQ